MQYLQRIKQHEQHLEITRSVAPSDAPAAPQSRETSQAERLEQFRQLREQR